MSTDEANPHENEVRRPADCRDIQARAESVARGFASGLTLRLASKGRPRPEDLMAHVG